MPVREAAPAEQRGKIALFTNVEERAVISAIDVDDLYKIPLVLNEQGLDEIIVDKLRLDCGAPNLEEWQAVVDARANPEAEVTIAMVGKYVDLKDAYISLTESLLHAGIHTRTRVKIRYVESENLEENGLSALNDVDAILVPGGFGERGIEGKIQAVRFARETGSALSRYLPRFAGCRYRVRAQCGWFDRCSINGIRAVHASSRHRTDYRMARQKRCNGGTLRRVRAR